MAMFYFFSVVYSFDKHNFKFRQRKASFLNGVFVLKTQQNCSDCVHGLCGRMTVIGSKHAHWKSSAVRPVTSFDLFDGIKRPLKFRNTFSAIKVRFASVNVFDLCSLVNKFLNFVSNIFNRDIKFTIFYIDAIHSVFDISKEKTKLYKRIKRVPKSIKKNELNRSVCFSRCCIETNKMKYDAKSKSEIV